MLPPDQAAVLHSIYEWCYAGRPSYRVLMAEDGLPKDFGEAARAFDQAAADAPVSDRTTLEAVPESMLRAEFFGSDVGVSGALRALEDRGFLRVIEQHLAICGSWKLPDGRRFTVVGQCAPISTDMGQTLVFEHWYAIDGRNISAQQSAAIPLGRTFRLTQQGIAEAEKAAPGPEVPAELESTTPPLDRENGQWVSSTAAAKIESLKVDTLTDYRSEGIVTADKRLGRDRDGRVWRRDGTLRSRPWYSRSTLKNSL